MSTYAVAVTREDGYWVGVVDGLRGGATESRTLAGLESELVDLIQGLLDLDESEVDLELTFGEGLDALVAQMGDARRHLAEAKKAYEEMQRETVRKLASSQVSGRDTAKLVGVSHQRVSQLLNT